MKKHLLVFSFLTSLLGAFSPQDVIKTHFPDLEVDQLSFKALSGGKSGSSLFEIQSQDVHWVYRQSSSFDLKQKINEIEGFKQASLSGLAPKTILSLPQEGIAVVEFNSSPSSSIQYAQNKKFLSSIAGVIKTLQTLKKPPHLNLKKDELYRSYRLIKTDPLFSQYEPVYKDIIFHETALEKSHRPRVFSHGDLSPCNIFVSPHIQLIDFSEVDARDPFYDLAYFAFFHNLDKESESFLLESYQPFLNQDDRFYYHLVKKILIGHLAFEFGSYFCYLKKTQDSLSDQSYDNFRIEDLIAFLVDPKSHIDASFCLSFSLKLFEAFLSF